MHALVVRLLEQRLNPTIVPLQRSQRAQVAEHARYHTGNTSDGLEEDEPYELLLFPEYFQPTL